MGWDGDQRAERMESGGELRYLFVYLSVFSNAQRGDGTIQRWEIQGERRACKEEVHWVWRV